MSDPSAASAAPLDDDGSCTHDNVTIGDVEYEHYDRRGPGCWHPVKGGTCRSWQALLDRAVEVGWASGRADKRPDAEVWSDVPAVPDVE